MKDIQSSRDSRHIDIRKVGVKTITYPISVLDKANRMQATVATVNMYVNLPHHFKGTHMSRFVEILNQFHGAFNLKTFRSILDMMKERLHAQSAHLEMAFPYFLTTAVHAGTHVAAMHRYDCRLLGSLSSHFDLRVEVDVPLTADHPVSQQGSGLVGLWGMVTVAVRMRSFLWIEDLIALVEHAMQSRSWNRETVESLSLVIGDALQQCGAFSWYKVVVKNSASEYSAFAVCQWPEQSTGVNSPSC